VLVLTRRPNESIRIGADIEVRVLGIEGDHVKLGIQAPRDVPVHRAEVYEAVEAANRTAAELRTLDPAALRTLLQQRETAEPQAEPDPESDEKTQE